MRTTWMAEAKLLDSQLDEALAEAQHDEGHAFEVVALAGLRERLPGAPASLAAVEAWLEGEGAMRVAGEIPHLEFDRRIEELVALPDDAHDERMDGTFTIDELSAGLTFCGAQARIAPFIDLLRRAIRATPVPWYALSPLASRILRDAPPLKDDPAGEMWRTMETTRWIEDPRELSGATFDVQRLALEPRRASAQAASRLLSSHAELSISLGQTAELTLARTEERGELFLEVRHGTDQVTAQRDGRPVTLTRLRPTSWSCPAEPGLYVFYIDGRPHIVEVG